MLNKFLRTLIDLKQLFKKGVVFLFVGLLICVVVSCGRLQVNHQPQKVAAVVLPSQIEVKQLVRSGVSWNGARLPAYPKGYPEITILRIVVPSGGILEKHKHPMINAGVLMKGELTVQTENGKTLHLKAGEAIVETVDTWHYGKNEGVEPAEIIVFYSGVQDTPITIRKPD